MGYRVDEDGVIRKPFVRSAFNYDADAVSRETALECDEEEGKTQQHFKEECDINEIVRRFGLTGQLPDDYRAPQSGDFTGIDDFHSAMLAVRRAEEQFYEIPAELRARFANDPGRLMDFLSDEKNRDEAVKLGLVQPPPERTRDVVQAVDELAAKFKPPEKPPETK